MMLLKLVSGVWLITSLASSTSVTTLDDFKDISPALIYEAKGFGCAVMLDRYRNREVALLSGITPADYDECAKAKALWEAL